MFRGRSNMGQNLVTKGPGIATRALTDGPLSKHYFKINIILVFTKPPALNR